MIKCVAIDAEPRDTINLTLWRNNELLAQVIGEHLSYSTELHPYGAYRCAVGNIHSNIAILHEKGNFTRKSVMSSTTTRNCITLSYLFGRGSFGHVYKLGVASIV